jgi:hypothetical protein
MKMRGLNLEEVKFVGGGAECVKRKHDFIYCAQSDMGNLFNDIANGIGTIGEMTSGFGT